MSICNFIAADIPLQEMSPAKDYPVHIDNVHIKFIMNYAAKMLGDTWLTVRTIFTDIYHKIFTEYRVREILIKQGKWRKAVLDANQEFFC